MSETWKLGKELSSPLMGRIVSISASLHLSESSIAEVFGWDHRSGTGRKTKNGKLTKYRRSRLLAIRRGTRAGQGASPRATRDAERDQGKHEEVRDGVTNLHDGVCRVPAFKAQVALEPPECLSTRGSPPSRRGLSG